VSLSPTRSALIFSCRIADLIDLSWRFFLAFSTVSASVVSLNKHILHLQRGVKTFICVLKSHLVFSFFSS